MNARHLTRLAAAFALAAIAAAPTWAQQAPAAAPASAGQGLMPPHGAMHGYPHAGGPGGRMMDPARMQQRAEQRLAALKKDLQITPEQEGAWSQFATAMKPPARPQRPDREAMAKLTTPERIDQMRALRQQRMAEADKRGEAVKAFYAALTPEQKKRFDERTARRFGAGPGAGGPGGMPAHRPMQRG